MYHQSRTRASSDMKLEFAKSYFVVLFGFALLFSTAWAPAQSSVSLHSQCPKHHHLPVPESPIHQCCAMQHAPAALVTVTPDYGANSQLVAQMEIRSVSETLAALLHSTFNNYGSPPAPLPLRI